MAATLELRSEDGDSIMTEDVDEATVGAVKASAATGFGAVKSTTKLDQHDSMLDHGDASGPDDDVADDSSSEVDAQESGDVFAVQPSTLFAGPSGASDVSASTPTTATAPAPASLAPSLEPAFPVCDFGDRLGYTYFSAPIPTADQLNIAHSHTDTHWLTVDQDLTYLSFFKDTGPLNVGCLYRFCLHIHKLLESPALGSKRIIVFSADEPDKKANAALLMALYAMIVLRWSPADALHPIASLELQPFRDAGYARADFHLSCQDVLFGARKAIDNRLLKLDEFDIAAYEFYEKVENGDWNYITPHFLAFASPVEPGYEHAKSKSPQAKSPAMQPKINKAFRNVLQYFEDNGVKIVVRLNKKLYDERRFTERGMEHREMYFDDGTNPTMEMCRDFIDLSERIIRQGGVVAVHCKAGLGRTGTLIGAYLIYKYHFTATEVIGFMRLMRPGTCVGPQQHFMYDNAMTWAKWGAIDRHMAENPQMLVGIERPITPPTDDEKASTSRGCATPRGRTPLVVPSTAAVPGQPRKTPGAKTRHAVAAPETVDTMNDDVFIDQQSTQTAQRQAEKHLRAASRDPTASREPSLAPSASREEDMAIDAVVVTTNTEGGAAAPAQVYIQTADGMRHLSPPVVLDMQGHVVSTAPASPAKTMSPSRFHKNRHQRPLVSINDNRQAEKTALASMRARQNSNASQHSYSAEITATQTTSGERYNLRTGRIANPLTNHANAHTASNNIPPTRPVASSQNRAASPIKSPLPSPSRLPQRIPPARQPRSISAPDVAAPAPRRVSSRKATVASAARTAEKVPSVPKMQQLATSAAPVTHRPVAGQGRSGRRRRSTEGDA